MSVKVRNFAALFSGGMAVYLLVEVAIETAHGTLLTIEPGRISVGSAVLLVAWLAATVYVAWLALSKEPSE